MATTESPGRLPKDTALGKLIDGLQERGVPYDGTRFGNIIHNSALAHPEVTARVLKDPNVPVDAKIAYLTGRVGRDLLTDGTRTPIWILNHPAGQAHAVGDLIASKVGLKAEIPRDQVLEMSEYADAHGLHDLEQAWARKQGFATSSEDLRTGRRIPAVVAATMIPAMGAIAVQEMSGNHSWGNILGGGRTPGYQAVFASEEDDKVSTTPAGELAARYLLGRSGRLLPWEEFTTERPDVSPGDYEAAKRFERDRGLFDVGLMKGTTRNVNGEPEYQMMGFRMPMSAAATAVGTMAGAGAAAALAEGAIAAVANKRNLRKLPEPVRAAVMGLGLHRFPGPRRVVAAAAGGIAGGVAGNLGSAAINNLLIQPSLHPDRVAEEAEWQAAQRASGML